MIYHFFRPFNALYVTLYLDLHSYSDNFYVARQGTSLMTYSRRAKERRLSKHPFGSSISRDIRFSATTPNCRPTCIY